MKRKFTPLPPLTDLPETARRHLLQLTDDLKAVLDRGLNFADNLPFQIIELPMRTGVVQKMGSDRLPFRIKGVSLVSTNGIQVTSMSSVVSQKGDIEVIVNFDSTSVVKMKFLLIGE